jgi:hypothetical protein
MNNLIGLCYVIESHQMGVDPIIYLKRPDVDSHFEKLHGFHNPFEAKKFIQTAMGNHFEILIESNRSWDLKYKNV